MEERRKWREKIRDITIQAVTLINAGKAKSEEYQTISSNFQLLLNPDDNDDRDIIETLRKGIQNPYEDLAPMLLAQVSRLLKHDWERAKFESSLLSLTGVIFSFKPNGPNIRRLRSSDYKR